MLKRPKKSRASDAKVNRVSPDSYGLQIANKRNKKLTQLESRSAAFDFFQNAMARTGYGTSSLPEATEYVLDRLSNNYWLLVTLYRNHWISRRIVDLPAQDMTRAWPKITCDLPPDDIMKFDRTVQRTYTPNQIRTALKWARLYGGAGALMALKGHEDILDEPLELDDITPGSYMGLIPFDRWVGITPSGFALDDYTRPQDWGLPDYYNCNSPDSADSFKVHSSRIIRFQGPDVPTPEKQAQIYWGISVLEPTYEDLRKRDNASWAMLNLMMRANIIARIEPSMEQMLSGLGSSQQAVKQFNARMEAQNFLLSNQSMMIMGKDSKLESVQYTFGGLADVYSQFQMDVAGAAEIPVTRLFGRTVTGLGQSNDADERYYEEKIAQDQNSELRPQLDKLYPVIMMSVLGEVPDDLDYTFPSVRVLTEEEKADMVEKASAPILAAYNSGVISQKTVLKELKQLSDVTNIFSNITDEDIENAEDEPVLPGEGEIGEGGEGEEGEPAKGGPETVAEKKALPNPQRALKRASAGAEDSSTKSARDRLARVIDSIGKDASAVKRPEPTKTSWHGLGVTIENPAGTTRSGEDGGGSKWSVEMSHDYGYLHNTEGTDGDAVDVFIGPDETAEYVYIIHTKKAPDFETYDEDKAFLNFETEADARTAFFKNYDRPEHFGALEKMAVDKFIKKVKSTKKNPRPVSHLVDAKRGKSSVSSKRKK
jgi:phage-related protein (TIGR01555 family)